MNEKQKKLIFKYMGWCDHKIEGHRQQKWKWVGGIAGQEPDGWESYEQCSKCGKRYFDKHYLDGNDMVAAMKKIKKDQKIVNFTSFAYDWKRDKEDKDPFFVFWLCSSSTRFFDLMGKWLEEKDG